jgi:hypothetical protein
LRTGPLKGAGSLFVFIDEVSGHGTEGSTRHGPQRFRRSLPLQNSRRRLNASQLRHVDVHHDDIGEETTRLSHSLNPVRRLPPSNPPERFQQALERSPKLLVIVCDQHPNRQTGPQIDRELVATDSLFREETRAPGQSLRGPVQVIATSILGRSLTAA